MSNGLNKPDFILKQDFSKLDQQFSDIDGIHLSAGKYVVLLEAKCAVNSDGTEGQKTFLQFIAHSFKIPVLYIRYEHQEEHPQIVNVANAKIIEFYYKGIWQKTDRTMNEVINSFKAKYDWRRKTRTPEGVNEKVLPQDSQVQTVRR